SRGSNRERARWGQPPPHSDKLHTNPDTTPKHSRAYHIAQTHSPCSCPPSSSEATTEHWAQQQKYCRWQRHTRRNHKSWPCRRVSRCQNETRWSCPPGTHIPTPPPSEADTPSSRVSALPPDRITSALNNSSWRRSN